MAYLDIISLTDAKTYLRIDDTLTEDDNQIIRMIKGSLSYIEQYTNVMLFARDKNYIVQDSFVKVYDYPINSEVSTYTVKEVKTLHTNYTTDETTFTLNVGYTDVTDVQTYDEKQFDKAISGLFFQETYPATRLRPSHFLEISNFEKYLTCWENQIKMFNKPKVKKFIDGI